MVYTSVIDDKTRARIFHLRHVQGMSVREVSRICKISRSSVWRIGRENTDKKSLKTKREDSMKRGRPRKITERAKRHMLKCFKELRAKEGNFTVRRLMERSGVSEKDVSSRTVNRMLNEEGYFFLQSRKKGLVTSDDLKKRVKFATAMQREHPEENFWTDKVAFYLDGTGFVFKTNPLSQAQAPRGRAWRKSSEGLHFGCTARGKKEGTGGKVLKLMVAISHKEGVVLCERYDINSGLHFANFIEEHFELTFRKAKKGVSRLWLQDGDPSQNSAIARNAMDRVNAELLKIPARSPDLNPIENFFHLVSRRLRSDAIDQQITKETFAQFQERVIKTVYSIDPRTIDNLIASMHSRVQEVIKQKGNRLKY